MKVYIKKENKRGFWIPVPLPMFIIRLALSDFVKTKALAHVDKETKKYIENIDFKGLASSISDIKNYKGLRLVEIADKQGNEVIIIV